MQTIHLDFHQRMMLWNVVGNHQAPNLKEAWTVFRIIEKIRPNDAEMLESQYVAENGRASWRTPSLDFGVRDIELENEEAKALAQAVESMQSVRVNDAEWLYPLVEKLKGAPAAQSSDNHAATQCG